MVALQAFSVAPGIDAHFVGLPLGTQFVLLALLGALLGLLTSRFL